MYLSQTFSSKNKIFYSIISVAFLLLFFSDFLFSTPKELNTQTQEYLEKSKEIGQLPFYAVNLSVNIFFLGFLFFIVYIVHKQSITKFTTSRRKIDFQRIFFAILVFGGLIIASIFIQYFIYPEDFVWNFKPTQFLILCSISILLLPFQTSFEEYLFRGYMMQWLGILSKNKWLPLFMTSILFGLAHAGNPEVNELGYGALFFYISAGFLFGIIALMDDGLELALGLHFVNNLLAATIVTSKHSVFQVPSLFLDISTPEITFSSIIIELIINLTAIFIFAKKYQWTNWKDKLFGKINQIP